MVRRPKKYLKARPDVRPLVVEARAAARKTNTKRAISLDWDEQRMYYGSSSIARQRGGMTERERKEALLDVYRNNPWASSCIDIIAKRMTSGGVAFEEVHQGKGSEASLALLQTFFGRINDHWDFAQYLRSIVVDILTFGEAYSEVIFQAGKPFQLYKIDCLSMTYDSDAQGRITGFTQTLQGYRQEEISFTPEQVIRWWLPSPEANLTAMAPAEKLKDALLAYASMVDCQINTFRRSAKHPYAVMMEGEAEDAQRQITYWRENYTGKKNWGAPIFLFGGAKIQEMGKGVVDLDFQTSLDKQRDLILSGYGVPPALAGIIESGNIGGGSGEDQEKSFRYNTIDPLKAIVFGPINWQIVKNGLGIDDWVVTSKYADYRDDEKIAKVQDTKIRNGTLLINEGRAAEGKGPVVGGDVAVFAAGKEVVAIETFGTLAQEHYDQLEQQAAAAKQQQQPGGPLPGESEEEMTQEEEDGSLDAPPLAETHFFVRAADSGGNQHPNS